MSGSSVDPGGGCRKAWTMSPMTARIKSFEEAIGMVTFVGKHAIVSQIRVARVSQSQIV